jgi:hypothetical protein
MKQIINRTKDIAAFDAREVVSTTEMGDIIAKYLTN